MSSSESDVCSSAADSSESSEYIFESQYLPYEGEPLAPLGEDITSVNSQETTEEADLDGLTPNMLELGYDRKNKVDSWCKCEKCSDQNLLGSLEFRCCHEITEALGKLAFDGSIEKISCVTLHEDFGELTNETLLSQVGPLLKDRKGRSCRCRSGTPFKEYIRAVAYRWLARWLFGYMGPENTRPLSPCIYENIRTRYYTGGAIGCSDAAERT